jgi:hypothetical protein
MYADTMAYKHNRKSVLSSRITDAGTDVPNMWNTETIPLNTVGLSRFKL